MKIAFAALTGANAHTLIRHLDGERVTVGFGVGDDATYPEFATGADNTESDLSTVSD
jgi:hypothetical protein